MERDESIDVRIEISAGWKVVKGFCDELHRKKKVSANICKSIGSDWVRVRLSEEGYHTSFDGPALHSLSQLLLTACTHMNMVYMRKVKNLFENYPYAPLHRWHSCTPAAEAEAEWVLLRHIQADWCLGICTDHRWIRNTKHKIRIRRVAGYAAYISTALALRSLSPSLSTLTLTFMCHAAAKATLTLACHTRGRWQRRLVSGDTWLGENCVRITAWKTEFIKH